VRCAENLVRRSVERGHPHNLWKNILPGSQEMHGFLGMIGNLFLGLEILFWRVLKHSLGDCRGTPFGG
jgi:hypothetical protein